MKAHCFRNLYQGKSYTELVMTGDDVNFVKFYTVIKVFYTPTDAQVNCLKNNFKIYIKIDIKTAPTCFGAITIIREGTIRALLKLHFFK
jgi:hypothetical protein